MKEALKRMLGFPSAAAEAETQKEDVTMTTEADANAAALVVTPNANEALLADLAAKVAEQGDALAVATAAAAAAVAELADTKAALAAFVEVQEKAEAEALASKLAARKDAIVAALGTDRADAFMAATAAMPDAQFHTVMAAMAVASTNEASQPEFKEVGVEGKADMAKVEADAASNGTMDYLKSKYAPVQN